MPHSNPKAYAAAGVDIDFADRLLNEVKPALKTATRSESLGTIGGFGGFFDISQLALTHPVLVASTDSVGTKVTAARIAGNYSHLGADIVNHCANDVAVCGAEPLFFLDYYATSRLKDNFVPLMTGLAEACKAANIALVGGETAEMPGVYAEDECDLVGTIVGAVEKSRILTGKAIAPGDKVIGLPSSGLHTNGFSLARKILFGQMELKPGDLLPGSSISVGEALLAPHRNYSSFLKNALDQLNSGPDASSREGNRIFGLAHITGGGFTGNIPRILPATTNVRLQLSSWDVPPVFRVLVDNGKLSADEAYEVFNMGIGLVMIVDAGAVEDIRSLARTFDLAATCIGEVTTGNCEVHLVS